MFILKYVFNSIVQQSIYIRLIFDIWLFIKKFIEFCFSNNKFKKQRKYNINDIRFYSFYMYLHNNWYLLIKSDVRPYLVIKYCWRRFEMVLSHDEATINYCCFRLVILILSLGWNQCSLNICRHIYILKTLI